MAIVGAFRFSSSSQLQLIKNEPFPTGDEPELFATDSKGRFLYLTNGLSENVSAYKIESDGSLRTIAGSPFATGGNTPYGLAVDATDSYLYVANFSDNTISGYQYHKERRIEACGRFTLCDGRWPLFGSDRAVACDTPEGERPGVWRVRGEKGSVITLSRERKINRFSIPRLSHRIFAQGVGRKAQAIMRNF